MTDIGSPDDRLAARREHLMNEIKTPSRRVRWTPKVAVLTGLTALAIGGGTVAVAGGQGVWRQDNGVVVIEGANLTPQYQGRKVSVEEIEKLNKVGKAMAGVQNIELGCHGITLYFDTKAEADAYGKGFELRAKAASAQRREAEAHGTPAPTDPCASWRGPLPLK